MQTLNLGLALAEGGLARRAKLCERLSMPLEAGRYWATILERANPSDAQRPHALAFLAFEADPGLARAARDWRHWGGTHG